MAFEIYAPAPRLLECRQTDGPTVGRIGQMNQESKRWEQAPVFCEMTLDCQWLFTGPDLPLQTGTPFIEGVLSVI